MRLEMKDDLGRIDVQEIGGYTVVRSVLLVLILVVMPLQSSAQNREDKKHKRVLLLYKYSSYLICDTIGSDENNWVIPMMSGKDIPFNTVKVAGKAVERIVPLDIVRLFCVKEEDYRNVPSYDYALECPEIFLLHSCLFLIRMLRFPSFRLWWLRNESVLSGLHPKGVYVSEWFADKDSLMFVKGAFGEFMNFCQNNSNFTKLVKRMLVAKTQKDGLLHMQKVQEVLRNTVLSGKTLFSLVQFYCYLSLLTGFIRRGNSERWKFPEDIADTMLKVINSYSQKSESLLQERKMRLLYWQLLTLLLKGEFAKADDIARRIIQTAPDGAKDWIEYEQAARYHNAYKISLQEAVLNGNAICAAVKGALLFELFYHGIPIKPNVKPIEDMKNICSKTLSAIAAAVKKEPLLVPHQSSCGRFKPLSGKFWKPQTKPTSSIEVAKKFFLEEYGRIEQDLPPNYEFEKSLIAALSLLDEESWEKIKRKIENSPSVGKDKLRYLCSLMKRLQKKK